MTGAPKLASLDALETLEAGPRGIYSGAMGWLGDNNTAEFNVIIRSMISPMGPDHWGRERSSWIPNRSKRNGKNG